MEMHHSPRTVPESSRRSVMFVEKMDSDRTGLVPSSNWLIGLDSMDVCKDEKRVNVMFVQATAWYLELDVWIIATSSTDSNPYIAISGNIEDETIPCNSPIITLGTKSNCHYQSLLPIEMFHLEFANPHQDPTEARELFNKVSKTETERNLLNESESRPQRTNSPLKNTTTESSCQKQEQNATIIEPSQDLKK